MVREETLDDALHFIQTTNPLNRCGVQDVLGEYETADVRLGLPTPDHMGVSDLYEECKRVARAYDGEGYRIEPQGDHHIDEEGNPYFYLRVIATERA